jgi:hypothetical protein
MTGRVSCVVLLKQIDGCRRPSTVRQAVRVLSLTIVLLLGVASAASAASFYWYGEDGSTCWQTGQLGAPSTTCDSVGAGFLPTPGGHTGGLEHMSEGGVSTDLTLSPSGDYCSYYRLGAELTSQDSTNEGSTTGYTTPTPYSSYQEGEKTSKASNVCQADGSHWGQAVRGPSGKGCTETCGMQHFVSFSSQGTDDRPWSGVFGGPSLVLAAGAGVHTFTHTGTYYGGWGYFCPDIEDTTTHGVLEYCFQEWRSTNNGSAWKDERIGECAGNVAMINTYFWPGTSYATEMSGSSNTFEVGSTGSGHYEAKITSANLQNAIRLANDTCAGWHISENVENYALVGVEQGLEGWSGVTAIGGYGENLELRTEYSPLPPEAATSAASEELETQAQLNGTVNPKGTSTKYYFKYGKTTSYGSTTPEESAGSGQASVAENAVVTDLAPGTTYHYRIVATSEGGTVEGAPETFTTPEIETSARWAVRDTATGDQWLYYPASTERVCEWHWTEAGWGNDCLVGETIAAKTSPIVLRELGAGDQWIYYRGTSKRICQWHWTEAGWGNECLVGERVASGTSPAGVRDSSSGDQWIYYVSPSYRLCEWHWTSSGWGNDCFVGESVAPGTSPTVVRDPRSGDQWVFYVGESGRLCEWHWTSAGWGNSCLVGEDVAADTSPNAVRDEASGDQWIYYVGESGRLCEWHWTSAGWGNSCLVGEDVAAGTSPSVMRDPTSGDQWIFYNGSSERLCEWHWTSAGWGNSCLVGEAIHPGTSPAAMRDPSTGDQWIYYEGTSKRMCEWHWTPSGWGNSCLVGEPF